MPINLGVANYDVIFYINITGEGKYGLGAKDLNCQCSLNPVDSKILFLSCNVNIENPNTPTAFKIMQL